MSDPFIDEDDENVEDETDLQSRPDDEAATTTVDWTVETVVSQMRKQRIDLAPSFQRRDAWTKAAKSRYIESLIQRYPVPQIVLAEDPKRPGMYLVIDGKQRLLSLRQFCADANDPRDAEWVDEKLKLTGLTEAKSLNGKTYEGLLSDYPLEAARFENSTIRAVLLRKWTSQDFLYTIFYRLNSGSLRLTAQELRQALFPGDFMDYIDTTSGDSKAIRWLLNKNKPDRRMVDAELLLRYLAFTIGVEKYAGNLKRFLDRTAEVISSKWRGDYKEYVESQVDALETSIWSAQTVFGDKACKKYVDGHFERSLNRAVFDVQMHYFADSELGAWQKDHPDATFRAFQELCTTDSDFIDAISSTTKTAKAVLKRFNAWGEKLQEASGIRYKLPESLIDVSPEKD